MKEHLGCTSIKLFISIKCASNYFHIHQTPYHGTSCGFLHHGVYESREGKRAGHQGKGLCHLIWIEVLKEIAVSHNGNLAFLCYDRCNEEGKKQKGIVRLALNGLGLSIGLDRDLYILKVNSTAEWGPPLIRSGSSQENFNGLEMLWTVIKLFLYFFLCSLKAPTLLTKLLHCMFADVVE